MRRLAYLVAALVAVLVAVQPATSAGQPPRLTKVWIRTQGPSFERFPVLRFEFAGGRLPDCDDVRPDRLRVTFKGSGVRWVATNEWCADFGDPLLGHHWTDSGGYLFENLGTEPQELMLVVSDAFGGVEVHKTLNLGYWASVNGKLSRAGRLQVRVDGRYRTIWYEEDDFVNVCINDAKKVYSSGGRLYCLDRVTSARMKLLR